MVGIDDVVVVPIYCMFFEILIMFVFFYFSDLWKKMDCDFRVFQRNLVICKEKFDELKEMLLDQAESDFEACHEAIKRAKIFRDVHGDLCVFPLLEEMESWNKV